MVSRLYPIHHGFLYTSCGSSLNSVLVLNYYVGLQNTLLSWWKIGIAVSSDSHPATSRAPPKNMPEPLEESSLSHGESTNEIICTTSWMAHERVCTLTRRFPTGYDRSKSQLCKTSLLSSPGQVQVLAWTASNKLITTRLRQILLSADQRQRQTTTAW